jgi:hypothetical protein
MPANDATHTYKRACRCNGREQLAAVAAALLPTVLLTCGVSQPGTALQSRKPLLHVGTQLPLAVLQVAVAELGLASAVQSLPHLLQLVLLDAWCAASSKRWQDRSGRDQNTISSSRSIDKQDQQAART